MTDIEQSYICGICKGPSFSKQCNLRAHVKTFHPDELEKLAPNKTYNIRATCNKCNKSFSSRCSLKHHMKIFHPGLVEDKFYPYKCCECPKQFSGLKNFNAHKKVHQVHTVPDCRLNKMKCPLCKYEDNLKSKLIHHFGDKHEIFVKSEIRQLDSIEEFNVWKSEEEKKTKSCFINQHGSRSTSKGIKEIYVCHRSGKYIPKGDNKKHLKYQGSNKINAFCPASISVIQEANTCHVDYIRTHIGHENDLGHLFLSHEDKQKLASKIAAKIPLPAILDEIRDSMSTTNFERILLLTKKDLYNIEHTYNLNAMSVRHRNDALSVEIWANELQKSNCVLFYKPRNELLEQYPHLKKEDFVLILMTDGQKEMLNKFGSDCICIDRTHVLNSYGFELVTLLVLDDMQEGIPCSFMISSRTDEEVMCILYSCIERSLELKISPKVFMSDMAESFFNAWLRVMNPPEYRLFCSWHVDRAWRKNLTKITSKEMQVKIYQQLRTLLQETDVKAIIQESRCENEIQDLIGIIGSKENLTDNNSHAASAAADLNEEKLRFKNWICSQVDRVSSMSELTELKRMTAPMEPTLMAMKTEGNRSLTNLEENKCIPHNKSIVKHRRLFLIKKKTKTDKERLKKPSTTEVQKTAVKLLHFQ